MKEKLFQRRTHILYCSVTVFGRKSKHMTDVTAFDMESIFTKIINEIIMVIEKYFLNFQNYQPRILNEHWCIYSCLLSPPRESWFQWVRRVYATTTNLSCISTLHLPNNHVLRVIQVMKKGLCQIRYLPWESLFLWKLI